MDGVGGRDDVRLPRDDLRAHHLIEQLEPPLLLEPAQEPERHPILAGELVEGHAEELGGAVHDEHADLAVEDPEVEAVEENPRAARVVDEELTVREMAGEVLDGGVEVLVPAVIFHGVIAQPERVERLPDPVLVRDARENRRPL
jgi:hypothetical protein